MTERKSLFSSASLGFTLVKRRHFRQEYNKHRQELRDKLPKLTKPQIRRFRMPYEDALLEDLREEGYTFSADFLNDLMEYQEEYRRIHEYDIVIMGRPVLRGNRKILNRVADSLKKAEDAQRSDNIALQVDALLKLVVEYGFVEESDWWWIAEEVLHKCIDICEIHNLKDDGFRRALVYYIFGKYQILQVGHLSRGMAVLDIARNLSERQNWSANKILGKQERTIYVQVCTLLYETLMQEVHNLMYTDPEEAFELCMVAKQRGQDACISRADIMMMQGRCEMELGRLEQAANSLIKAYLLFKSQKIHEKACEAHIYLALAYMEMDLWEKTTKELMKVLEYAKEYNLRNYEGIAYMYMGQYHLNHGTPKNSTPYLTKAFVIFHDLNDFVNREFVQNLGAVSQGQELLSKYVELILKCEIGSNEQRGTNLLKLCRWKDSREPFWDDQDESSSSTITSDIYSLDSTPEEEAIEEEVLNMIEEDDYEEDPEDYPLGTGPSAEENID